MIRVLLVEDHTAFREALAVTLAQEADLVVTGQAGTLREARTRLENVDVAVIDLDLPDGSGAGLIRELHLISPYALALVLTGSAGSRDVANSIAAGAAGVLHKSTPISEIISAIRRLHEGEALLSRAEVASLVNLARSQHAEDSGARQVLDRLTPRERDVLRLLAEGLSDRDIAARLHVSKDTVHTHMVNLLGKLQVESRLQALIFAIRHGIVKLD